MLTSYRTEAVERREGGIEGVGLFATKDLAQDQLVALKGGRLITERLLLDRLAIVDGSHHQIAPSLFLTGVTTDEVDATLIGYNHSCDPNAYIDGHIAVRTRRPVPAGEELTVDYATIFSSDTQSFQCQCGSSQCRHRIKPSVDSHDPELRVRHADFFADFLAHPESYEGVELVPIDSDCPTTSYVSTKVARIDAAIHGLGLQVTADIRTGELLAIRGGTLLSRSEVMSRQAEIRGTEVQITDEIYLAGLTDQARLATLMGFNHSCDPNSFLRGQIGLFALSDIIKGTELTVDYATTYISPSQRFPCNCGTRSCRGFIDTTTDWQNPELQARFTGHFADFVQRKIDGELADKDVAI